MEELKEGATVRCPDDAHQLEEHRLATAAATAVGLTQKPCLKPSVRDSEGKVIYPARIYYPDESNASL